MKASVGLGLGISLFALLLGPAVFAADDKTPCVRDGKSYPHGTALGGYICVNGTWKKL